MHVSGRGTVGKLLEPHKALDRNIYEAPALSHNGPAGFRPAGHEHMSRHAGRLHTMFQHVKDQLDML